MLNYSALEKYLLVFCSLGIFSDINIKRSSTKPYNLPPQITRSGTGSTPATIRHSDLQEPGAEVTEDIDDSVSTKKSLCISIKTLAFRDSPLAQLTKESDMCLFLHVWKFKEPNYCSTVET